MGAELPGSIRSVCIENNMAADAVKKLGVNNADMVDWAAIASHLGQPEAAPFMKEVAKRTMWRRSLGGPPVEGPWPLTATSCEGGRALQALGHHLAEATINLMALGKHDDVKTFSN